MMKRILTVFFFLVFASGNAFSAPDVGDDAPDFTLEECDLWDITLSDQQGRVVFLNFWETM